MTGHAAANGESNEALNRGKRGDVLQKTNPSSPQLRDETHISTEDLSALKAFPNICVKEHHYCRSCHTPCDLTSWNQCLNELCSSSTFDWFITIPLGPQLQETMRGVYTEVCCSGLNDKCVSLIDMLQMLAVFNDKWALFLLPQGIEN